MAREVGEHHVDRRQIAQKLVEVVASRPEADDDQSGRAVFVEAAV